MVNKMSISQGMPQQSNGGMATGMSATVQKDITASAQAPQLGELLQKIQGQYGEKEKPAREIKKTLDKDDFLRIMIAQMKNQDPTNPFKAEQMATEMAQFSSVEQLHNVNQNLTKMSAENKPLERLAMTNLIGKTVTVSRDRFPHNQGQSESLKFDLPKDAGQVKIAIVSETGEAILEKELGSSKKGEVSFQWDGKKSNSLVAGSGNYLFRIEAKDDQGRPILMDPSRKAKVVGLSFERGETVLLVGDTNYQDRVSFNHIIKIDMDDSNRSPAPEQKAPTLIPMQQAPTQIDAKAEVKPALQTIEAPMAADPVEKGFPNGLQNMDLSENKLEEKGERR